MWQFADICGHRQLNRNTVQFPHNINYNSNDFFDIILCSVGDGAQTNQSMEITNVHPIINVMGEGRGGVEGVEGGR